MRGPRFDPSVEVVKRQNVGTALKLDTIPKVRKSGGHFYVWAKLTREECARLANGLMDVVRDKVWEETES